MLEDQGVGYDEAWTVTLPSPFVCCRTNRSEWRAGEAERTFERFYVGRGKGSTFSVKSHAINKVLPR